MRSTAALLLAAALVCLSACGFRPVYADVTGTGAIQVENIPGRAGHTLRKELLRELAAGLPGVPEGATLSVSMSDSLTPLSFAPDGAASRSAVRASARYVLALDADAVSGRVSAETNFNVPGAPYGDIAAQLAASDRAMSELSRRIVEDLRFQLSKDK